MKRGVAAVLGAFALASAACGGQSIRDDGGAGSSGTAADTAAGGSGLTGGSDASGGTGATGATGGDLSGSTGGTGGDVSSSSGGISGDTSSSTGGSVGGACPEMDADHDGAFVSCFIIDDCDDNDPSVQVYGFVDADGDGWGDPNAYECLPAGALPRGYVLSSGDCDDLNRDVYPDAPELVGDGIDSNCDGLEGGVDCSATAQCPCNDALSEAPATTTCDGVDLAVAAILACPFACGSASVFVQIVNYGATGATGIISVTNDGRQVSPDLAGLPAGKVSVPFQLTGPLTGPTLTVVSTEPGDCNPANDTTSIPPIPVPLCR